MLKHITVPDDPANSIVADSIYCAGLTKREYFAGLAMQSMLDNLNLTEDVAVKWSVSAADALIAELNK